MALFRHPTIKDGSISIGETHPPVIDGVVEAPDELGRSMGWTALSKQEEKEFRNKHKSASTPAVPRSRARSKRR